MPSPDPFLVFLRDHAVVFDQAEGRDATPGMLIVYVDEQPVGFISPEVSTRCITPQHYWVAYPNPYRSLPETFHTKDKASFALWREFTAPTPWRPRG